jgi:arylsulfatase A-like enzyme
VVSNWVVRGATGLNAGFHRYDDSLPQREAGRAVPERIAADTTDAALAELDACLPNAAARCFLWVHYQDPHGPYTPPGDWRARYLERERAERDGTRELPALPGPFGSGGIPSYQLLGGVTEVAFYRAGYDAEVAYLDEEVGRLLEGIAARGLRDAALVVFTADHGESLGEDDYWFSHGERLSDPLVRVPLLLRAPGAGSGPRPDLVALVDVFPTLTQAVLGSTPEPDRAGRALLAEGGEAGSSVPYLAVLLGSQVHRFGVVDGEFKYLAELRGDAWNGRLLKRDDESVDLTAPAPHVAAAMRSKLEQLHQRYHRVARESRAELSPEDREKLEALGYAPE